MSIVINRTTKQILISVNTPEFDPSTWIINPTLPVGIPEKYLNISGDVVTEMNQTEKDAVGAAAVIPTDASGNWKTAAPANNTDGITRLASAVKQILNGPIE